MIKSNLRILLAKANKRVSDIHKATGISKVALYALYHERGKGVQFTTLSALCKELGCEVGDLLEYQNNGRD